MAAVKKNVRNLTAVPVSIKLEYGISKPRHMKNIECWDFQTARVFFRSTVSWLSESYPSLQEPIDPRVQYAEQHIPERNLLMY